MKAFLSIFLGVSFFLLLFGCGGGGGGTGGGPLTLVSWSSIVPPATVETAGISQETEYMRSAGDSPVIETVSAPELYQFSTATFTYDADGIIERIELETPNMTFAWDTNSDDSIEYSGINIFAIDSLEPINASNIAAAVNPEAVGWDYQTFGVWETNRQLSDPVVGYLGAMSMGAPTPQEAVPLPPGPGSDQVYFNGHSNGIYVDQNGIDYYVYSDLTALVDFKPSSEITTLTFETTNNYKVTMESLINTRQLPDFNTNDPNFAMSGTLTYSPTTNQFTGQLTTPIMSGDTTGQFYGPAAQELGGVFFLTDDELNPRMYYSGAYGAAQSP